MSGHMDDRATATPPEPSGNQANAPADPWVGRISVGVGILALVFVLLLTDANRDARERNVELLNQLNVPTAGMYVPAFVGEDLDGDQLLVGTNEAGQTQVLLYFNTRCPYCRASIPWWKSLAQRLQQAGTARVVGISLDSLHLTRRYAAENSLNYAVVHFPAESHRSMYRAKTVPITVVVRPDGLVTHVRQGPMQTDAARDSLEEAVKWTSDRWTQLQEERVGEFGAMSAPDSSDERDNR